jgi:hypothetical protein
MLLAVVFTVVFFGVFVVGEFPPDPPIGTFAVPQGVTSPDAESVTYRHDIAVG